MKKLKINWKKIDLESLFAQLLVVAILVAAFGFGMTIPAYLEGPRFPLQILSIVITLSGVGIVILCQVFFLLHPSKKPERSRSVMEGD